MRLAPLALLPALLLVAACGTEKKAPTAPPPAAGTQQPTDQLPPGHPPMNQLPPGHPPMSGQPQPGEVAPTPVSAEAPAGSPVTWQAPEGWTATRPANQMRIANFRVAETTGVPVEVVVFGGIGGTAQQNIQRWIGQFAFADDDSAQEAALVRETEVNGLQITRLDVTGKFGGGDMGGATDAMHGGDDYRMLAVVVEGAAGPLQVKLVGPAAVVGEQESAFDAFVSSFRSAK